MPRANKKSGRGSSTKGTMKGQNCQRSELKNLMSKNSKLHKTNPKLYLACINEITKIQKAKGTYLEPNINVIEVD